MSLPISYQFDCWKQYKQHFNQKQCLTFQIAIQLHNINFILITKWIKSLLLMEISKANLVVVGFLINISVCFGIINSLMYMSQAPVRNHYRVLPTQKFSGILPFSWPSPTLLIPRFWYINYPHLTSSDKLTGW